MAKLINISPETEKIFDGVLNNTTIPQWVEFKLFCDVSQKEMCKIVKANNVVKTLNEIDFVVTINEDIFDMLPEEMQKIAIDECLTGVGVSDSDALSLNKEDFNTHTGVLQKYGDEKIISLHESIISLYDAKKQKDDEEKAAAKEKRKNKQK